jgi:DNA-binding CsgD family transcriptional regulator
MPPGRSLTSSVCKTGNSGIRLAGTQIAVEQATHDSRQGADSFLVAGMGENMTMNALTEVFAQTTDAVFGIDAAGRIRFANSEFERLLGYPCSQLCDSWCADVLCGTDIHGQPFCGEDCPIPKTADARQAVRDFDLVVRRADGDPVLTNIGACYIPSHLREQAGRVDVFFSLRRVNPRRLLQRMAKPPVEQSAMNGARNPGKLTSREKEILGLAAAGLQTSRIASRLCISPQTVRTHFRNIYPKLGVNSRTEAVIHALQHGPH